jgi:hypothetical protein
MKHALAALLVLAACGGDPHSEIDAGDDGAGDDGAGDDGAGDDGAGDDGAGDDGAGDDVAEYTSGTRIRRRMGTTPDGAKMFLGWRDIMRNEDCNFLASTDGVSRCLPAYYTTLFSFSHFSDSRCSIGLVSGAAVCTIPPALRYVLKLEPTTCSGYGYAVLPITGTHSGTVYQGSPASCVAVTTPSPSTFYTLGPAISPSAFQSMTESVE